MEDKKRGRPTKFNEELMTKIKALYSGTRTGNRHIQNHFYQSCSYPMIMKYHKEHPIDNFEFLYKDDMHLKETIFTELGRTNDFLCEIFSCEEANAMNGDVIINMTNNLPNVKDAKEFVDEVINVMKKDRRAEGIIKAVTVDRFHNKSRLQKYNF